MDETTNVGDYKGEFFINLNEKDKMKDFQEATPSSLGI